MSRMGKLMPAAWLHRPLRLRMDTAPGETTSPHHALRITAADTLPFTMAALSISTPDDAGRPHALPLAAARRTPKGALAQHGILRTPGLNLAASLVARPQQPGEPWLSIEVRIRNRGTKPAQFAAEVFFLIPAPEIPRWMIPGIFYKDNNRHQTHRQYPRFDPDTCAPADFVSPFWSFRNDRCATPAVFARIGNDSYFLSTGEECSHGLGSVGFAYKRLEGGDAAAALTLQFPWRELPARYAPYLGADQFRGEITHATVAPGAELRFRFRAGIAADDDNYGFAPVIRALYARGAKDHETNPWMTTREAADLAAYGIYHWFHDAENRALVETCSFDRYFADSRGLPGYHDRPHMHVAWISGIPHAHLLARWGRENGHPEYVEAGHGVVDRICEEGLAPCGAFWGQWKRETDSWDAGWNPDSKWLHAGTLGEAATFLAEAIRRERVLGHRHPAWERALKSNLDFALRAQDRDGCLGTYYHCETGEVTGRDGSGGLGWIPALVQGATLLRREAYLRAAEQAGDFYQEYVDDAVFYGGCEDIHLSPSSDSGYQAINAYMALYEATAGRGWLENARRAAEWTLTMRWMHNTHFPPETLVGQYGYRTFGADIASPPNQHMHSYGLLVHASLIKLWMVTGDRYYLDRARDHVRYSLQMIARADGDMGARRGMISEQWYHTDWWQPKGMMLLLAHVWCAGFAILAHLAQKDLLASVPARFVREIRNIEPEMGTSKPAHTPRLRQR